MPPVPIPTAASVATVIWDTVAMALLAITETSAWLVQTIAVQMDSVVTTMAASLVAVMLVSVAMVSLVPL